MSKTTMSMTLRLDVGSHLHDVNFGNENFRFFSVNDRLRQNLTPRSGNVANGNKFIP